MKDSLGNIRAIAKNSFFLLLGRFFTGLSTLFLMTIVANKLGVKIFGIYTLSLTVASIFGIASNFGLNYLTIREVAKDRLKMSQYLLNGSIVKLFLIVLFFLLLMLFLNVFFSKDLIFIIYLACISSIFIGFTEFYVSFFNAFEKMYFNSIVSFLQSFLVLIVCLIIIYVGFDKVIYLFYAHIAINILLLIFTLILLFASLSPNISNIDLLFSLNILKESVPFGLFFIGGVIYFQTDTIMISIMKDVNAVGFYQAPIRLILVFEIFPTLISSAMFPTISKLISHSKEEAGRMMKKVLNLMLIMSFPASIMIFFFSQKIILAFFSGNFIPSILVLKILAWIIPIRFCAHVFGTTLSSTDKQYLRALATGFSAVLNIGLNFILIPYFNYYGAAVASLATSFFLMVFYYLAIKKEFLNFTLNKILFPPLIATIIMGFFLYWLINNNIFITLPIAIIIYISALSILNRFFNNKELFWSSS